MITRASVLFVTVVLLACGASAASAHDAKLHLLHDASELSLDGLGPLAPDATNRWADDADAAALGQRLFFDARLSSNCRVSCGTCHDPQRQFQDGRALGKGVGTTSRRTMPVAGAAESPFLFWDGRKDSLWSQALGPLESPVEHGGSRARYAHVIADHYRKDYERVFGPLPDLRDVPAVGGPVADPAARAAWNRMTPRQRDAATAVFVNVGKAIAAYERQIRFAPARFDRFVGEWKRTGTMPEDILDAKERAGLGLFVGKAQCTRCHNGPLFTNNEFHNTGVPARKGLAEDRGRIVAVAAVQADEFNCRSRWSDAKPAQCAELAFLAPASTAQARAFKVPSLRNVAERAPYMHAGQIATLKDVIRHYDVAVPGPVGRTELTPLQLTAAERDQIEAFLRTLSGGVAAPAEFLRPPAKS
jgi:cytochrome c peroxidase